MATVLPSTVQELNSMQSTVLFSSPNMYVKDSNKGFENIATEKRIKREVSLPTGVENWNIGNYESYLNFEDNLIPSPFEAVQSEDRLVPEEGYQRGRCESFSSASSAVEDNKPLVYHNLGVKSFKTVAMDSGSTCFSSDHSYLSSSASNMKFLDVEETYENLDVFFQQVPELNVTDSMSSSLSSSVPSPAEVPKFEFADVQDSFGLQASSSQSSLDNLLKRTADIISSEDELNPAKRQRDAPIETYYFEHRRKNNIASKNCRKTRKEKQKEMESRISDLEKEREGLKVEVRILEEMIQAHKQKIFEILRPR
ncbi:uncharacterized protein LOC129234431 [Uloborus diversus]|uniref:uncharacterized protein LOC129234431 n=1 Tax=Uloborus diversus TaxID=327109 RepID=UPI00240A4A74|nr:uncharacterized protein LOC129234431 [Uloborus diversus]